MTDAAITAVEYYWRPGCPFCMRLESALNAAQIPLHRHNIWEDDAARAHVRSVADGNETVPTVTIGEVSMVNPSPAEVIDVLAAQAPELVPDNAANASGSRLRDKFRNR